MPLQSRITIIEQLFHKKFIQVLSLCTSMSTTYDVCHNNIRTAGLIKLIRIVYEDLSWLDG